MGVMMYECDYCCKQFRDTPAARRRHLLGVAHQRAKSLWYNSLRYEAQIDDPQLLTKKGICNHFVRTGGCQYGDSCKFYHPKKDVQHSNVHGEVFVDQTGNLPPSLRPPPQAGYPPLPFLDWG